MPGKFSQTVGSRAQVWHGTAKHTSGGLEKKDLMKNKNDRIVSRAKHNTAKKEMRLVKHGFGTKKGKFGFVKIGSKSRKGRRGSRKIKGGMHDLNLAADVNSSYMLNGGGHAAVGDSYMFEKGNGSEPLPNSVESNHEHVGGRRRRRRKGSRSRKGSRRR
jgi:hypothetical protein